MRYLKWKIDELHGAGRSHVHALGLQNAAGRPVNGDCGGNKVRQFICAAQISASICKSQQGGTSNVGRKTPFRCRLQENDGDLK
jgi:hypothetical protein